MILLLGGAHPAPGTTTPAGEALLRLEATRVDDVLAAAREGQARRVVAQLPAVGLNVFSLARALRRAGGPPLVLVGPLRRDQRFWAERNGGAWVERLEDALGDEVPAP